MAHLIAIPKLGLTMVDCTLTGWTKADGERVEKGEVVFEIETDKITSEVEADAGGYLRRFAGVDSLHVVGAVIGGMAISLAFPGARQWRRLWRGWMRRLWWPGGSASGCRPWRGGLPKGRGLIRPG